MFTTCFFCSADLGRNEALEAMPVGRRVAFNQQTGRLWVVCRACERWSLVPLEERWEAIEACERQYRDTRKRVATDNVGLARVADGLDLIRIGEPLRPEFAAWRYGDQFGRRRRRQLAMTGGVVGAASLVIVGGAWAGASVASFSGIYANGGLWDSLINGSPNKKIATVRAPDGRMLDVRRRHARMTSLLHPSAWGGEPMALRVEHFGGTEILTGAAASRAAQQLLPAVNRFGGSKRKVSDAVSWLESSGGPEQALQALAQSRGAHTLRLTNGIPDKPINPKKLQVGITAGALHTLDITERLALEMALHEESERRAMQGELAALEIAWREAEEIARISDSLFETDALRGKLDALRDVTNEVPGRDACANSASSTDDAEARS